MRQQLEIGKKALITTDGWFTAPDGKSYRGVFGTVRAVMDSKETLGIQTNAKSTNWYVEIGSLTVAGCQIHYAVRTDRCHLGEVESHRIHEGKVCKFNEPSSIYDADKEWPL